MEGFIIFDHAKEYPSARKQLAQWLAEGKLKRQETIVKGGLKVAEQTLDALFKGSNTGEYPRESGGACRGTVANLEKENSWSRSKAQTRRTSFDFKVLRLWCNPMVGRKVSQFFQCYHRLLCRQVPCSCNPRVRT